MIDRLMHTIKRGIKETKIAWSNYAYRIDTEQWNDYDERILRYFLAEQYYYNSIYTTLNKFAAVYKADRKLYKHIRGLYNPVERLVEAYVSYLYGGNIGNDLFNSSIPIQTDDDVIANDILDIFHNSNFNVTKTIYARNTILYGDGYLHIASTDNYTYIEVIDPYYVEHIELDYRGFTTYARLAKEVDGIVEIIEYTLDEITYATSKIEGYIPLQTKGSIIEVIPNPYGFIPLVKANFKETNNNYSPNSFYSQTPKIDEINDIASLLSDNVRNTVQQLYHLKGGIGQQISSNANEPTKDQIRIIYANGEFVPLGNSLNIEGTLAAINSLQDELANDLPVLALSKLREMSQITAPAVRASFGDGIKRLREVQTNLDSTLSIAIAMALSISSYNNHIENNYELDLYTSRNRGFSIKDRMIIDDTLGINEKVQYLLQLDVNNPTMPLVLETMGLDADSIEQANNRADNINSTLTSRAIAQSRVNLLDRLNSVGEGVRNNAANDNNVTNNTGNN